MAIKSFLKRIWNASPASLFKRMALMFRDNKGQTLRTVLIEGGQAEGIKINLPSGLKSYYSKMADGNYEPYILNSLLATKDLSGKVIWDIGTHIGYHALLFAKYAGSKGKVIAFEPNPENQRLFKNNIVLNNNLEDIIAVRTEALSDKAGKTKMLISPDPTSASSSGSHIKGVSTSYSKEVYKEFREIEVEMNTIDDLVNNNAVPPPDVIKMDVEGAEYAVLKGGEEVLRNKKPVMVIEIHTVETMHNVLNFLSNLGYSTKILDSDSELLTRNILATPNI